jgi:hypothetical protein
MTTSPSPPPALNPAQFVTNLLQALYDVTGKRPPPTWTKVDKVQSRLATDNRDAIDAAIRVAAKRGWLRINGDPPESITITVDGVKFLEPKPDLAKPAG